MELGIMYPEIIVYSIIAAFLLLFVWRKKMRFKKGIIVANTKFIKNTKYYKKLLLKYRFYNIIIKILCISLVIGSAVLTARVYKIDKDEEEVFNRDIMLCMDVSGSMDSLNTQVLLSMKDIVSGLKDERFGITLFDSSPLNIVPFTTDYDYSSYMLDEINNALYIKKAFSGTIRGLNTAIVSGVRARDGASLIGDGLAYCASTFKKDEERTKVIILTTDNMAGKGLLSVSEAADYCKENNIKIYAIDTEYLSNYIVATVNRYSRELQEISKKTGGEYYSYKSVSVNDIINRIEELEKTSVKNYKISKNDLPELIFPYLLFLLPILLIMEWRVKL